MDDHFDHYRKPGTSREQSVDRTNLAEASKPILPSRGRSSSRQPRNPVNSNPAANPNPGNPAATTPGSRTASRNRTPALPLGTSHTDMDLDLRRKELEAKFAQNGDLPAEPEMNGKGEDPALRFRGQPSQEIAHLGTIPKRTESLYLKQSLEPKGKVSGSAVCLHFKWDLGFLISFLFSCIKDNEKSLGRKCRDYLSRRIAQTIIIKQRWC